MVFLGFLKIFLFNFNYYLIKSLFKQEFKR